MNGCGRAPGGAGSSGHGIHHTGNNDWLAQQIALADHVLLHQRHLLWSYVQAQVAAADDDAICCCGNAGKVVQCCPVLNLHATWMLYAALE